MCNTILGGLISIKFTGKHYSEELLPRTELVFDNFEDAMSVLKSAVRSDDEHSGDYCVLVSREENLYVLNFLYAQCSDRNDVVFMDRGIFDEFYHNKIYDEETDEDGV